MYFVYVLQSETSGRLYIGSTGHLIRRFHEHQRGKTRATRHHGPWFMPYYELVETRSQAVRRERKLKAWKNAARIRALFPRLPERPDAASGSGARVITSGAQRRA
jgi:putative endonuclease